MTAMRFHHIGIACRDIQDGIESIRKIHEVVDIGSILFDKEQNAHICLIKTAEGVTLELISGEPVEKLVKKGITYYHVCYETTDIDREIIRLQDSGAILVSEPKPAILFGLNKAAFLYVSYGLIELIEIK